MLVEVALPIPLKRTLTYRMPEGREPEPGMRVAVPLGSRVLTGVIVSLTGQSPSTVRRLKNVIRVLDDQPALTAELLQLGKWVAEYYQCSWGEALSAMLPAWHKPAGRELLAAGPVKPADLDTNGLANRLWTKLEGGPLSRAEALRGLPAGAADLLEQWQDQGLLASEVRFVRHRQTQRPPEAGQKPKSALPLTPSQARAWQAIQAALDKSAYAAFLLHGVTASGKTEIYLQAITHALRQRLGAILLVPEIALTPQMCARVKDRFGSQVEVLHSGLSAKERAGAWQRLRWGEARIALGARSAVFAPLPRVGLIIVDEEAETSYKQEDAPRYHARDVAAVRAKAAGAVLVLGSATPALESYYNAMQGRYRLLVLPERVDRKALPEVQLVDMGQELGRQARLPLFSQTLSSALEETLQSGEQSILLLNRRGYAPVVMCPRCRQVVMCPDCSLGLVYHQADDALHCHACGRKFPARPACPRCGAACLRLAGAGTQRVMEELARHLPRARCVRLDVDVTRQRGALEKTLERFSRREADILVGTQMVAKGFDFPGVSLVGIISADTALHLPDFRAEEKTFQLLVQVAGRAGRGGSPGRVVIQTFHPGHPAMLLAQQHNYEEFYRYALAQRRELQYPPFARLAKLVARSREAAEARKFAEHLVRELGRRADERTVILGPAPAARERLAGEQRYVVLLKCPTVGARSRLLAALEGESIPSKVKFSLDIDPQDLL